MTTQDKIIHRKESHKRIIINDSEKRNPENRPLSSKPPTIPKPQETGALEKQIIGKTAFITKKGENEL